MKKILVVGLIAVLGAGALSGCAKSSDETASSDSSTGSVAEATDEVIDTEEGSVILADYPVTADKYIYSVSEEDIDEEVEYLVYDYADYNVVDRAAQKGDYVWVVLTATADGEELESYVKSDEFEVPLDGEYYGDEFDEHIIGSNVGDELEFSVAYAEDDVDADYPGTTVDYTVKIIQISEEILPELTDEFIQEELGYESEEDMREQIRAELEESNASDSEYEYREEIMAQYIDKCTFVDYDEELYELYYQNEVSGYEDYVEMFEGIDSVEDVYELFGMTDDDVRESALDSLYRAIIVDAITEKEGLEVTDEIYEAGLERYAEEEEYDSTDDLVSDYGEETLRYWMLDDLVLDLLESYATANEKEYVEED